MYFEVHALPSASAAATKVHTGNNTADQGSFAGDTLTDSSKKDAPTKRGVVSAVADEGPKREGK